MPARTLNDFFAGFFYGQIWVDLEVKRGKPSQEGEEKVKEIKVEGEWEKKEVIVRHKIVSLKWKMWNDEDF